MIHRILTPRRLFLSESGLLGLCYLVPVPLLGCSEEAADDPGNTRNEAWESESLALEARGGGIYTAADPRDLAGKEASHVPVVMLSGSSVTLSSPHEMRAATEEVPEEHYITHHYLRDLAGVIFALKKYAIGVDTVAQTTFTLPPGTTEFIAFQACNLHNTWST
jgi:desulfoferrodoxin (superoxide reductase-like protein)